MKKTYENSLFIIFSIFFLCVLLQPLQVKATTLDTATQLIQANSGNTVCNNTTCVLDSFTMPTLGDSDTLEIQGSIAINTASSSTITIRDNTGGNVWLTIGNSVGGEPFKCDVMQGHPISGTTISHECFIYSTNTWTNADNGAFGNTIQLRGVTTANRTYNWHWQIYLIKGSGATTTITEENGTDVPQSRTITIGGTTYDLSANRTWSLTAGTGISISGLTITNTSTEDGLSHLPSQTGNSGKFLTTNGSVESWGTPTDTGCTSFACLSGVPTTLSGYGITDAVPASRTLTINGTGLDLSANRTWSVGTLTSVSFGDLTSHPTTLSGYGITDSLVPSTRTITIDGVGLDLSTDRSWTTSGGGGCTTFDCLTGTEGIFIYDEVSQYIIVLLFLLITFGLTFYITYKILKKTL